MFPYWLLFLTFAMGALWFSNARTVVPEAVLIDPATERGPNPDLAGHRLLLVAGVGTALMIGLRFEVGTDWRSYEEIFDSVSRLSLPEAITRIDPAYGLLNWLVAKAGPGIWLVNLLCGLLFMFGLVRFARHQPNPWLAIAVAVPYLVIGVGMGFSRQAVAIGLSMAGLVALSKGSFNRFVFWVLFGALFHRTAVILIPIVAIAYSRNRFQAVAVGFLGCLVGYYVLTSAQGLEHFQRTYVTRTYEAQGAGIRLAMNLPPAILCLAFSHYFTGDPIERRIWLNFAGIAALSFVGYLFISSTAALDRMALYVIPLQIFIFSRIPTAFANNGRSSGLLVVAVIAYSALIEFVWLNYSNNAVNWIPYELYPVGG